MSHKKHGFTLIELSIVLVVLGLIVGGTFAGLGLYNNSQLMSVMTQVEKYRQAGKLFKEKYSYPPGDFPTASTQFDASSPNGDGNSLVCGTAEYHALWQHLSLGQFIEGNYTGVAGSGGASDVNLGENAPRMKLFTNARVGFAAFRLSTTGCVDYWSGTGNFFAGNYGNLLMFGQELNSNEFPIRAALTPSDASAIDSKYDDGQPALGAIVTFKNAVNTSCSTTDDYLSQYNLTFGQNACAFMFKNVF